MVKSKKMAKIGEKLRKTGKRILSSPLRKILNTPLIV